MLIREVHIKNWRSHAESKLAFGPGTNVIIGRNGAGKTSVLDAIYFGLFGALPGKKKYGAVLRRGTRSGEVKLVVEQNGKEYHILRQFGERGITYSEIREKAGESLRPISLGKKEDVNEVIEELFGLDAELFERIVYAIQNEIDYFVNLSPGKRKAVFDHILGLDYLEKIRKGLVSLSNLAKKGAMGLADKETQLKQITEQLELEKSELEEIMKKLEETKKSLEETRSNLEKEKKRLSELEEKFGKYKKLSGEKERISALIEELKKEAKPYSLEEEKRRLEKAKKMLEEAERTRREIEEKRQSIKVLEGRIQQAKKQLEQLPREAPNVEREIGSLDQIKKTLDYLRGLEKELLADIKNREEHIALLETDLVSKKTMLEEGEKRYREYLRLKEEIRAFPELQKRVESIRKDFTRLMTLLEEKKALLEEIKDKTTCPVCGADISNRRDEIQARLEREYEEVKEQVKDMEKKLKELEKRLSELEEKKKIVEELERFAFEYEQVKEDIKETGKKLEEEKETLKNLKSAYNWVQKLIGKLEEYLGPLEERIRQDQEISAKYAMRKELETTIKQAEETIRVLEQEIAVYPEIDLPALVEEVRRAEERVRAAKSFVKMRELEKELEKIEKELQGLIGVEEELKTAEKKVVGLSASITHLKEKVEELTQLQRKREENIARFTEFSRKLREEVERLRRMKEVWGWAKRAEEVVKKTQEFVRSQLVEYINKALAMIWNALYPYPDYTAIRLVPTENDYRLEVLNVRGEWVDVSVLSGGERSAAALALRIAVSAVLSGNARVLLLDEPTHNLDENVTTGLAALLRELPGKGIFDQIILITHKESLQQAATAKIYLLEREEGPTKVKELGGGAAGI